MKVAYKFPRIKGTVAIAPYGVTEGVVSASQTVSQNGFPFEIASPDEDFESTIYLPFIN